MKWPTVMPTWQYCPSNVTFDAERAVRPANVPTGKQAKDSYYRRARQLHVKQALRRVMRGKR